MEEVRIGMWPKVLKRYLGLFSHLKDPIAISHVPSILVEIPECRDKVYSYYQHLGYTPSRFRDVENFLLSRHCVDDGAVFGAARLLVKWEIPLRSSYRKRARRLAWELIKKKDNRVAILSSSLWLLCTYGRGSDVAKVVARYRRIWRGSEWGARQVAAATAILGADERSEIEAMIRNAGLLDGLSVLAHLAELRQLRHLRPQVTQPESCSLSVIASIEPL
jgi:hypothetical protein